MIKKYSNQYIFYRIIDLSHIERAREAYQEHFEIFKTVKKRDLKKATQLMNEHIEHAKEIILSNFDTYTFG